VILLILGCISAGELFAADHEDFYKDGIKAFDMEDYENAEKYFEKAYEINNNESPKLVRIYGTVFLPYLPHYYRGVALFELDRCDEAVVEFEISIDQNALEDVSWEYYKKKMTSEIKSKFKDYRPEVYCSRCGVEPENKDNEE
jgi:tetratricopeptide (TPR) repeat protein